MDKETIADLVAKEVLNIKLEPEQLVRLKCIEFAVRLREAKGTSDVDGCMKWFYDYIMTGKEK